MLCPRCGNILDESETSCKNCGTRVNEAEIVADENQPIENVSIPEQQVVEEVAYQPEENLEPISQPELEANLYQDALQYDQSMQYNEAQVGNQGVDANANNKLLWIAVVLIVVVSVAIGFLMVRKMQGTGASNITAITTDETKKMDEDKIAKPTTVELYGYKLTVPSNYETRTDGLMVYSVDYKNKVSLVFTVMRNVSFEDVTTEPDSFKKDLQKLGFEVETYNQKKISGRRWLMYNGTLREKGSEYDALYAISPIGTEDTTFHTTVINAGFRTKDAVFEELGDILDKAEFTGKNINGGANNGTDPNPGNEPEEKDPETPSQNPGAVSA